MRREEIPRFSSRESKSHQILTGVNLKLQSLNHKFWASTYHQPILEQSLPPLHWTKLPLVPPKAAIPKTRLLWPQKHVMFSFKVMDFIFVHGGSDELALVIGYRFRICCFLKHTNCLCFWCHFFGSSECDTFFHTFCLQNSSLHQGKPRLHDASTRWSISLL